MIPRGQYAEIMKVLPILCVDVVIKNLRGEYLLIKRGNRPLRGRWWVVGGRLFKKETLEQAAIRKVREEVGLDVETVQPFGYYEDTCETNPFGLEFHQHSVSVVFLAAVDGSQNVKLDYQSTDWKYSKDLPRKFLVKPFGNMTST